MRKERKTPTKELYDCLERAFQHFNEHLFDNKLPDVMFTVPRQQGIMGYFSPNRWESLSDKTLCHEIAINPRYVGRSHTSQAMQTLVHEV